MTSENALTSENIIASVRSWVLGLVINLNLCPFAKRELVKDRVRFVVTDAASEDRLLAALQSELQRLESDDTIETTLLIHPHVLQDFCDYNQFLDVADQLLAQMQLDGVYQIASFHPDYQFAGTAPDAAENYSNRSPYPLLHLLREDSLEHAIAGYPDVEQIPQRNIERLNAIGRESLHGMLQSCVLAAPDTTPVDAEYPHDNGAA